RAGSIIRHLPRPALPGAHQIDNAGIVLAAMEMLQAKFPTASNALADGLTSVRWPARLQKLAQGPLFKDIGAETEIWIDGGHNADAARVVADAIRDWRRETSGRSIHLVFGTLNSRDPKEFLAPFQGLVDSVATVAIPGEPNTISAEDGAEAGRQVGVYAQTANSVADAIQTIMWGSEGPRVILICGSLYLAGTVLRDHS
ncbi:MAG: bifunctional folylpolyglutamate synthase/dihydrofolate synthase, partial [Alphaproteobacteria bacterium]|nr:bifunctional folylpolyglutamate synthase/dihydrofolate synthase [Alphaproteobacteria bacterium]